MVSQCVIDTVVGFAGIMLTIALFMWFVRKMGI